MPRESTVRRCRGSILCPIWGFLLCPIMSWTVVVLKKSLGVRDRFSDEGVGVMLAAGIPGDLRLFGNGLGELIHTC